MSRVLVLGEHEVTERLPMRACIDVMEAALSALARGEVHQPLRQIVRAPGAAGMLGLMPSYRGGAVPYYGLKEVCVFPSNPARGLDTHLGSVLLHSGETGELLAVLNASAITAIRTAAVTAVATRLLARDDAAVLAIVGSGVQARSHLESIPLVRDVGEIRITSRDRAKAEALARREPRAHVVETTAEAVRGADIVVLATSSKEPVVTGGMLEPGMHLNAVGSSVATSRELDGAAMAACSLFVDRRESTLNESGDFLFALREGVIGEGHIRAEIGEILTGKAVGRRERDEITLFKSLGLAIEDLATAAYLYEEALRTGEGTWIEF